MMKLARSFATNANTGVRRIMKFQYWIEYAKLHLISLKQDLSTNKTNYLIGQIDAVEHLINVATDIQSGTLPLTIDEGNDKIDTPTIEGKQMNTTHEHYWDTPTKVVDTLELDGNNYPVVAECACGESILRTPF